MLVAVTETVAPLSALESAAIASARRGPILGRLPTICTETFAMAKPFAVILCNVSFNNFSPDAPAYAGSDVPKLDPRSPS